MSRSNDNDPSTQYNGGTNPNINFPPLPHTVAEVSQLLAETKDEPDTLKLAEIVDSDPVVAASVLRRINSAYYGMRRRIGNVRKAVMLLGFLEVANIVLTAGMVKLEEVFADDEHSDIFESIMQVSVGVAQTAREMAGFLDLPIHGRVYAAGLLHSVGRLVFLYNHPDRYEALWTGGERKLPSVAEEEKAFGVNHAVIGGQAADNWKLPHYLVEAIRHYPDPTAIEEEDHRTIALLLAVSASVVQQYGCAESEDVPAEEIEFEPPSQLDYLAYVTETDADELIQYIVDKREQIRGYVDTMTHH